MNGAPPTSRASLRGHPGRLALVLAGAGGAGLLISLPLGAVFYYALRDGARFGAERRKADFRRH